MALRTKLKGIRRSTSSGLSAPELCLEQQKQRETFTHFKKEYKSWSIL